MIASVGIAATVFLLALQPAFATGNNIVARQLPSGFDPSQYETCKDCTTVAASFANTTCANSPKCICSATMAAAFDACIECAQEQTMGPYEAKNYEKSYQSTCAKGGMTVSGLAALASNTTTSTGANPTNTSTSGSGSAGAAAASTSSKSGALASVSINTFGVLITAVLGSIALL